jgi:undecaprenyl-diphosphatase
METRPDSPTPPEPVRLFGLAFILGLLVAVGALAFFGWLAEEMLEGETRAFDDFVRSGVHHFASPGLTRTFELITRLGGPSVLAPLGVAAVAIFLLRGWRRGAMLLGVAMAGAGVLEGTLKLAFHRARPAAFFDYPLPRSYSFPSGHALFAFCFFATVAALAAPRVKPPALRVLLWTAAIVIVLLIGVSRIYLGVHYPSDVAAGYSAGLLWVAVVSTGDRVAHHRAARRGGA